MTTGITVELEGHLCDPLRQCEKKGKGLDLFVKRDGIHILTVTFHMAKRVKKERYGEIEKYIVTERSFICNSPFETDMATKAIRERFSRYTQTNKRCSVWVDYALANLYLNPPMPLTWQDQFQFCGILAVFIALVCAVGALQRMVYHSGWRGATFN